ncbi:MAG: flagellar biosynthetic protein FliR [Phycisphaerales bacterium]|nr:flagellar biosynthetic protein FliR [Phycisphaerales bacterium]
MQLPNLQALLEHVQPALMVTFRLGGLAVFAPVLASPLLPVRVRVLLVFMLGLAVYPAMAGVVHPAATDGSLPSLAVAVASEAAVGMLIGLVASLPLVAAQTGGLVMGQQMGLGFARFYNPAIGEEADVLEQFLFLMLLAAFVAAGGIEAMVGAVLGSFERLPPGQAMIGLLVDRDLPGFLSGLLLSTLELALRVSAPLLAFVFLETVVLGFLAKTVPQLNVLSLGFPLRIVIGLGVIVIALGPIGAALMDETEAVFDGLAAFVEEGAHG